MIVDKMDMTAACLDWELAVTGLACRASEMRAAESWVESWRGQPHSEKDDEEQRV